MTRDGWHTISGYMVYVENGYIVRGLSHNRQETTYVYRVSKHSGWDADDRITIDAFRAGIKRGTIRMF